MSTLGLRLRDLRSFSHMSQQEVADRIGTSRSSINMYERGEREPGLETLCRLAALFGVTFQELLPEELLDLVENNLRLDAECNIGLVRRGHLTPDEGELVTLYRDAEPTAREYAKDMLRSHPKEAAVGL